MLTSPDDLLDNDQTAALLGIKPNTLEGWRCRGKGPAYLKFSQTKQGTVRYRRSEVMAWLATRSFANTSAYEPALRTSNKHQNCPSKEASR